MNIALDWLAASLTVAILLAYELSLAVARRRRPERMARTAHANLRGDWFAAVSAQKGSEVLAVQTLRNALMSASRAQGGHSVQLGAAPAGPARAGHCIHPAPLGRGPVAAALVSAVLFSSDQFQPTARSEDAVEPEQ